MPSLACAFEGCNKPAKHRGYCEACYSRLRKSGELPLIMQEDRLFSRVTEDVNGCWLWGGGCVKDGYGTIRWNGRTCRAHRVFYEYFIIEIPEGLDLDHLCRVRRCVNPWHLDPVTRRVNVIRGDAPSVRSGKTHCPHGHPYDEENTIVYEGRRFCRACKNVRQRAYDEKKRRMSHAILLDPLG